MPEESHKVFSDRTKLIDEFVYTLNNQELLYSLSLYEIEDYIAHLTIMYRALIAQPSRPGEQAVEKPNWVTPEGKPDDWAFATFYMFVAMNRQLVGLGKPVGAILRSQDRQKPWHVGGDNLIKRPVYDIRQMLKKRKRQIRKSWKYR